MVSITDSYFMLWPILSEALVLLLIYKHNPVIFTRTFRKIHYNENRKRVMFWNTLTQFWVIQVPMENNIVVELAFFAAKTFLIYHKLHLLPNHQPSLSSTLSTFNNNLANYFPSRYSFWIDNRSNIICKVKKEHLKILYTTT